MGSQRKNAGWQLLKTRQSGIADLFCAELISLLASCLIGADFAVYEQSLKG
jgi:hypothetical protein